jgi:hypothetical protein
MTTITKAPWYKEAAGTVAVFAWLAVIAIHAWAIFAGERVTEWWYTMAIVGIGVGASMFRYASPKINVERNTFNE